MDKLFVTYRFQPNTVNDLRILIDNLIKYEKMLKQDEDTEVVLVCDVEKAEINIGTTKLSPTETYEKNLPYEVIPQENITLHGVCDLLTEKNEWKRIFPTRPGW
ncbi:MAG: hypothetical protein ACYC6K_04110 [Bellilinea sp.]